MLRVFHEDSAYEILESSRVELRVHCRDGIGINLQWFVGMLQFLGDIIVLEDIDYPEVEKHIMELAASCGCRHPFTTYKKWWLGFGTRYVLCSRWQVHSQANRRLPDHTKDIVISHIQSSATECPNFWNITMTWRMNYLWNGKKIVLQKINKRSFFLFHLHLKKTPRSLWCAIFIQCKPTRWHWSYIMMRTTSCHTKLRRGA